MPGTKNRTSQPPANARVRRAAHREREAANHRTPSPERQARLHPSRADKANARAWAANADFFDEFGSRGGVQITRNLDPTGFDVDAIIKHTHVHDDMERLVIADESGVAVVAQHPLPWRAPDRKLRAGGGWLVLDANGDVVEYAKSRDKARARVREANAS